MKVSKISNTNFSGRIIFIGEPTEAINHAINSNPLVQNFISGNKNLLVKILHRDASKYEVRSLRREEDLYKIKFKKIIEGNSIFVRFFNWLRGSVNLARDWDYHSEYRNLRWINNNEHMQKYVFNKLG